MSIDPELYHKIVDQVAAGVITVDAKGTIIAFNPAAGALLELDAGEVLGQTFAEVFLPHEELEPFSEIVLRAIYNAGETQSEEIVLDLAAERRDLLVSSTYLRDEAEDGRRLGVIVLLTDLTERRKRKKIKRLIGQYIDPRIVERIIASENGMVPAVRREMTVSFVDLAGFTSLSETMQPEAVLDFLNGCLTRLSQAIGEQGGVTDKYIGDSVMAWWGEPFHEADEQAYLACAAALAQARSMRELHWSGADGARIGQVGVRIGIATGPMVTGNIGPEHARNFTVIGDTVNLASRLEGLNKEHGTTILVCAETRRRVGNRLAFRSVGTLPIRGRLRQEEVFELLGEGEAAA